MKDWLMEHKLYVFAAVIIALGGFFYFFLYDSKSSSNLSLSGVEAKLPTDVVETKKSSQQSQGGQLEKIMVDVKGQIKQPGVYQASVGERVKDVINRAGGLTDNADESGVNFAERVVDEMVIYIPAQGELAAGAATGASTLSGGGSSNKETKIDLNKADVNELQNLPGIGPAKATAIIEYREKSGPFKAIEDLKNISGIGDKTFEKLQDLIVVH